MVLTDFWDKGTKKQRIHVGYAVYLKIKDNTIP